MFGFRHNSADLAFKSLSLKYLALTRLYLFGNTGISRVLLTTLILSLDLLVKILNISPNLSLKHIERCLHFTVFISDLRASFLI